MFQAVSKYPSCENDIAFWIPDSFSSNDFYDLVGSLVGDLAERVELIDVFTHPQHGHTSHCYRITYRHFEKTFTQDEVNSLHQQVETLAI